MAPKDRKTILFLCTGNSCRSQMAEGFARHLKSDELEVYSAGLEKHGLNPLAVKVMAEKGIDISAQQSNLIEEIAGIDFDFVITLCDHAAENCPVLPGRAVHIHKPFADPPKLAADAQNEAEALARYRQVRDDIEDFVADELDIILGI